MTDDVPTACVGALVLTGGLIRLNLVASLSGLVIMMLSKLWFVDRTVWIYPGQNTVPIKTGRLTADNGVA